MLRFPTRVAFSAMSAVVAAGIVAFADPANAASIDTEVTQRVVHYGDLDLASAKGRAAFERRLVAAADDVCPGDQSGPMQPDRDACRRQALANARHAAGIADD